MLFSRYFYADRLETFVGYYRWQGELGGVAHGATGGLRGVITEQLTADVTVSNDQFFGTNVFSSVTLHFDQLFNGGTINRRDPLYRRVERNTQIAVRQQQSQIDGFNPLRDQTTGDEIHLFVASENGSGTGTPVDPSNINAIVANPDFASGSAMVLVNSGGPLTSAIGLTADRQQVLGPGSSGLLVADFSAATGDSADELVVRTWPAVLKC